MISGFVPLTLCRNGRELSVLTWVALSAPDAEERRAAGHCLPRCDLSEGYELQLSDWGGSVLVEGEEVIPWQEVVALYEFEGTTFEAENEAEIVRLVRAGHLLSDGPSVERPGLRRARERTQAQGKKSA